MTIEQHFERSGAWLFRWRSYLPVLLFALVVAGLNGFRYPDGSQSLNLLWSAGCLALGLLGLAIRVWTVGHVPPRTSGRNTDEQVADTLNTTGTYSAVRHPLYLGNYLMWLSVALVPRSLWVPIVVTLVFWLYHERIIFAEERFLKGKFGDEFLEWAARTPLFVPSFSHWIPARLPFSTRVALRREHTGLLGLVIAINAVIVLGDRVVTGEWRLDPRCAAAIAAALAIYAITYLLKKTTRLLHVAR